MKMSAIVGVAVGIAAAAAAPVRAAELPRFGATPLNLGSSLPDYGSFQAVAMNDLGQVVGYGNSGEEPRPLWLWTPGAGARSYPELIAYPQAINNAGVVVLNGAG